MLKEGRDGVMWIGTNHGLARFRASGNGFKVMTTADGLFANNVFSLAEASDGSLWVGSFGGVARIMGYQ
jgi:ligand-binding sensor domain-containing protein